MKCLSYVLSFCVSFSLTRIDKRWETLCEYVSILDVAGGECSCTWENPVSFLPADGTIDAESWQPAGTRSCVLVLELHSDREVCGQCLPCPWRSGGTGQPGQRCPWISSGLCSEGHDRCQTLRDPWWWAFACEQVFSHHRGQQVFSISNLFVLIHFVHEGWSVM